MRVLRAAPAIFSAVLAMVCLLRVCEAAPPSDKEVDALNLQAKTLYASGKYAEAMGPARKALELAEQRLGPDSLRVATLLRNLGQIHLQQKQYAEADSPLKRALSIQEKAVPPDDKNIGVTLKLLGLLYTEQKRYADAEPLLQRALSVEEKVLGPNDKEVRDTLELLVPVYGAQRRYADAESLVKRALSIIEKTPDADPAEMADLTRRLALLAWLQGLHSEAASLAKRALSIIEKVKGPDSPGLLPWLDTLARYDGGQGAVETVYQRELAIVEKAHGPDDPAVAEVLDKLADAYGMFDKEKSLKAEAAYKRGLAIMEKVRGPDHIDLRQWHDKLGKLYLIQDRYSDAEAEYRGSLAIVEKAKGPEHPDVVSALDNLASADTQIYGSGKLADSYAKVEPLYRRSLAILEKAFGPDDPKLVDPLNKLGFAYNMQRRRPEAEAAYKRAVAIIEKAKGPDSPDLVVELNGLADLYMTIDQPQYDKAEPIYRRALAVLERAYGDDSPDIDLAIFNLASLYERMHRYAEAEPLYRRGLAIREKTDGADNPALRSKLDNVANISQLEGHYREAEKLYRRSLALAEKESGPDSLVVKLALDNLIKLYKEQFRYADAEPLMRRVLAIAEKQYNSDQSRSSTILDVHFGLLDLGRLLQQTNRLEEAEAIFRKALSMDQKAEGPSGGNTFNDLMALGGLLSETNKRAEAEALLRRAINIVEHGGSNGEQGAAFNDLANVLKETNHLTEAEALYRRALPLVESFGDPRQIASLLSNFGQLLQDTGRDDEAEPLLRRALALGEKQFGPNNPNIISPLNNLAALLEETKRYSEAEPLLHRSLAIAERTFGSDHPKVAIRLGNLAALLVHTNRTTEAEPLLDRALAIDEKSYGADSARVAGTLNLRAELLLKTNRLAEAEQAMRRALPIDEKSYGPDHPAVVRDLHNLAIVRARQADWQEAVSLFGRALPGLTMHGGDVKAGDRRGVAKALLKQNAGPLRQYARALYRDNTASASERGFEAAEWAQQTDAADALAQMSARFAKGDGPLVDLIRGRQNLLARRQAEDKRLLAIAGQGNEAAADALRKSIADIDHSLDALDAKLADKFPDYAELTDPEPLTIPQIQELLDPKEALVVFLDISKIGPLAGETLVWTVTKHASKWRSIPMDTAALGEAVDALRCGLDEALWFKKTNVAKCLAGLKDSLGRIEASGEEPQSLPFDLARAHELYEALLGPDEHLIKGKDLLIVPSGPLTSLPFGVLITEPPTSAIPANPAEYATAAWLGSLQAIDILPSVESLKALRRLAKASKGRSAYLGIGDPLLDGDQRDPIYGATYRQRAQAARARQRCGGTRNEPFALVASRQLASFDQLFRGAHADIEQIREASPLPETADELCDVGRQLGAKDSDILLGDRASETELKDLSKSGRLADYRIVHFATHGALAGQVRNAAEPGLILTPPERNRDAKSLERDDGFLTASEIASLKLDADWVILSACNTASGASRKAEALSGLARAFFYAGARSLLVSHWAVNSEATVTLVTGAFDALARHPRLNHAEALQQSMRVLIKAGGKKAHPSYWAPFVVVGAEGPAAAPIETIANIPVPVRAPLTKMTEWERQMFRR